MKRSCPKIKTSWGSPPVRDRRERPHATFALALAIIFLVLAIRSNPCVTAGHHGVGAAGHQWRADRLAWGMATMNIYSQVGLITSSV